MMDTAKTGSTNSIIYNNHSAAHIQPPVKIKRLNEILESERLPHPQPIHPIVFEPSFQLPNLAPLSSSNLFANNFLAASQPLGLNYFQQMDFFQKVLNQMMQINSKLMPSTSTQQIQIPATTHEEQDSGNETSSISPGTSSPISRSSRFFLIFLFPYSKLLNLKF